MRPLALIQLIRAGAAQRLMMLPIVQARLVHDLRLQVPLPQSVRFGHEDGLWLIATNWPGKHAVPGKI